jgi:uncharacterized repeat protein (TIGR01451 family)
LPPGQTFVSAIGAGWACAAAGQNVTCTLTAGLAAGVDAGPITHTVGGDAGYTGGPFTDTATVSSITPDPVQSNNQATDVTSAPQASADLAVTDVALTGGMVAGGTGSYLLTVANLGPSVAAAPVMLTDVMAAGETFVSAGGSSWVCAGSGASPTVICTRAGPIASGVTAPPITLVVAVASAVTGALIDTATVSSPTPDPTLSNNTATATDSAVIRADLAITSTHTGAFTPGTRSAYRMAVHNGGPSDAVEPVVSDVLPAGETLVSATGTAWSCSAIGQTVTCILASGLIAGADAGAITLTVAIDPAYTGTAFTDTATVSSSTPDPVMTNNTATDISAAPIPSADLALTNTMSPSGAVAGGQAGYLIAVTNAGPSDAAGPLTMVDTLPVGETFGSAAATGWNCAGDPASPTVTCTLAAGLPVGASAEPVTVTVAVGAGITAALVNTATVSSPTADPDLGNNTASDTSPPSTSADLSISKTHAGDLAPAADNTYTLAVHNAGPSDAVSPTVTDQLPAYETFVAGSESGWLCTAADQTVTCTLAAGLAAGADAPLALVVDVLGSAYPSATNTASVSSPTPDPVTSNDSSTASGPVSSLSDLTLTIVPDGPALAGADLTYTMTVTNLGPTPDPGPITITDPLPVGETYVSAVGQGWTCDQADSVVTCTMPGPLPLGTAPPVTLVVALGAVATVLNTAKVTGGGMDPRLVNNVDSAPSQITPVANLVLAKKLNGTALVTGASATYTISVTNFGPSPTSGLITVNDVLPAGLVYQSSSGTGWTCTDSSGAVGCTQSATLAVGSASSVSLTVLVTAATGSIINHATVTSLTAQTSTGSDSAATPPVAVSAAAAAVGPAATSTEPAAGTILAFTGAATSVPLGWGIALLLSGLFLVLVSRRRRKARTVSV